MMKTATTETNPVPANGIKSSESQSVAGFALPRVGNSSDDLRLVAGMQIPRIGNGYDVHALAPGLPFFLGGLRLDHPKGCVAHSDGDCLIHAVCDALLGALALGDIGTHFPDNSEEFRGIDSKILLKRTYDMIRATGYRPGNVDCTVCLQAPKISHRIPEMRAVMAGILEIPQDRISVKATTTEYLGFVGREEGIAVYATVLLWPVG
jgi:2-C-methyl-D-erythritol 2,4-cyclodiphosphate synthase